MENPNKARRGRRKENIPPHSSSYATPEQRRVQKNVNINLFPDSFKDTAISHPSSRAAVPSSNCERTADHRKSEAVTAGGAKPHHHILVQTNLSCPYRPVWDTPSAVCGGSSQQQSNLKTKLQRRRPEDLACVGSPSCLGPVDFGSGCSRADQVSLKSGPENGFSGGRKSWSQKPRGLGLCGVPHSCDEISQSRFGNKDPHILKHPRGCSYMSEGGCQTLGAAGDSFCPTKLYERPPAGSFLHDPSLHPESPSGSCSSLPPGPPLTLDHLRSSTSAGSRATSTTLHVLLRSSQVSADLHSSIQHLKQETSSMGALSSFPWEPKSFPLPHLSHFDPRVSSSGRPSTAEQRAGEQSCAKQASVKWRDSLARDWGLRSTPGIWEAPHPFGCGCRNTGLCTQPMEASDQFWPLAFCGGGGPTSLACRGEEGGSNPSFCHLRSCSRIQQVLERKGPGSHLTTHCQQKMLDPEELPSRFLHCPEWGYRETSLYHPSFDGLEVSWETLHARPPVNVGVTLNSTHGEVRVTVRSPEVDQLGNDSKCMDLRDLQDEAEGADRVLLTPLVMDESVLFVPAHNSLEAIAGGNLGAHSSAPVDSLGPPGFEGTAFASKNSSHGDRWPDVGHDRGEEFLTGKNTTSSKFPPCKESRHGMDAVQKETLGRKDGSMDGERNRMPPQSSLLLASYFAAWRNRVSGKKAAAQALYEQQLLRKGLGALKWAVELHHVQVGIAQRRHDRMVLAACFRRWQDATVKRQKAQEKTPNKDSLAVLGGEKILKGPVLHQLSAECLEAATQYGRAEGNLWLQIHRRQGAEELDRKAQGVRDMRRLAAAFRLWRLQKEHLDAEESRAQDACALREKKRLRNAFETWRSRYRAVERISPLVAQIQQRLVSRCFNTWKGCAERRARARCSLDRRRVGALRLCFRQWTQMVQAQEQARKMLLELLALRQRVAYARFGFAPNAPKTQPHLNVVRQFQRNGSDTVDGLCVTLVLQETFYTWRARWCQQRQLDAFCQAAEQKLLREALGRWRWKACRLPPFGHSARDLAEEPVLALLDSDEYSVSSGFHSNAPALPAFSDSLEREASLLGSSPGSISSLAISTDARCLLQRLSPSPTPSPGWENLGDEALEFSAQASSPLRNQYSETDDFIGDPFPSLGSLRPECGLHSIAVSSSGEVPNPRGGKKEIAENQRQLLARCFELWSSWTRQNLKGKQLCRHRLLSRAFTSWSAAAARTSLQRKAQVWLENVRQQRLLASCFARWKAELLRAQEQREENSLWRRPTRCRAVWRWRKAVRGYQALRLGTGTVVQQSCNYWTKAGSFYLCLRERSSLVGAHKFVKMPLSWPSKQRRNREEGLASSVAIRARLNGSSFHTWLVVYRSQRSTAGSSPQGPPDSLGRAERTAKPTEVWSSSAETDSTRQLWQKYLRLWRCSVLLRRFRESWRTRHLARAWLLWKGACQAEWVVQALARERLALWGWKVWRRRYLQMRVAERFLEAQDRSLLQRVFERWHSLAAEVSSQPQGSF